jgi:hypothetical protein
MSYGVIRFCVTCIYVITAQCPRKPGRFLPLYPQLLAFSFPGRVRRLREEPHPIEDLDMAIARTSAQVGVLFAFEPGTMADLGTAPHPAFHQLGQLRVRPPAILIDLEHAGAALLGHHRPSTGIDGALLHCHLPVGPA